jgi:hypothetical protein
MGGSGSGRNGGYTRPIKERSLVLNINRIKEKTFDVKGKVNFISGIWTWQRRDNQYNKVKYRIEGMTFFLDYCLKDEPIRQAIVLVSTRQPNGGERYWFLCPAINCSQRCTKLYLPPGRKIFACRKCHNLTYKSCNESHQLDWFYRRIANDSGISYSFVKNVWAKERKFI